MTAAEVPREDPAAHARDLVVALSDGCATCKRAVARGAGNVHCPAHDDAAPSLSVSAGRDHVLIKCHTGCSQEQVISILRDRGLWHDLAAATPSVNGVQRWDYRRDGALLGRHCRRPKPGGGKIMWWELPDGATAHGELAMRDLPLYGAERLSLHADMPVLVVEGEKAADAGILRGLLAVSLPGGAGQTDFGTALHVLAGRDVVLLPDNDLPGRELMRRVESAVRGVAASVRLVALPGLDLRGDLFDYFATGATPADLRAVLEAPPVESPTSGPALPTPRRLRDLLAQDLPPIHYAVEGILPEGVTLCAGGPKLGKSFLALNIAIAVAGGGKALGDLSVDQGDVLYLCLEGGEHSIYDRAKTMLAGDLCPEGLYFETDWPQLDAGGTDGIARWMETTPNARLVIVDTLQKVRPPTNSKRGGYEQDYEALQRLTQLSHQHHVSVIVVHHTNKAGHDDPINRVSGTTGLTGAVDTIWVFQRVRGEEAASLGVSGRMCPETDLGLLWDNTLLCWRHAGDAADVKRSQERRSVVAVLAQSDTPLDAPQIAGELGRASDYGAVRHLLWKMERSGELLKRSGGYVLADALLMKGGNAAHSSNDSHSGNSGNNEGNIEPSLLPVTGDLHARDPAPARVIESGDTGVAEKADTALRARFVHLSRAGRCAECAEPGWWLDDRPPRLIWCEEHALKLLEESP